MATRFIQGSPINYQGRADGAVPPSGYIGQTISSTDASSTGIAAYEDKITLTLTAGTWAVTGSGMISGNAGATGFRIRLNIKNAGSYLNPTTEQIQSMPTASYASINLPVNFVTVTASDVTNSTNKVIIGALAAGAASTIYTSLSAVRIA